jgi:hypothetical protein
MSGVGRRGDHFVVRYTTGPQDLLLMLDLQPERIADPYVTALNVSLKYGNPEESVVRAAVLAGTDEANVEFGTNWHPLEIRYSYSGYDNRQCRLMSRAAYDIVKELAERGPESIEVIA